MLLPRICQIFIAFTIPKRGASRCDGAYVSEQAPGMSKGAVLAEPDAALGPLKLFLMGETDKASSAFS